MKRKLVPVAAAIAAGALALLLVGIVQAGKGDVYGTAHDMGTADVPTCEHCHIPHKAQGEYLWAQIPYSWAGESKVLPLCFSCHDEAIASGDYIVDPDYHNHPQGDRCYDKDHDGICPEDETTSDTDGDGIFPESEDMFSKAPANTSCLKCMQPDCGKCHDAHSDAWVFLEKSKFISVDTNADTVGDTDYDDGSVCVACHTGSRHGIGVTHPEAASNPEGSNTNLPLDRAWDADASDFSGTRLFDSANPGQVLVSGSGDIRCMTCHDTHGGLNEALNTMSTYELGAEGEHLQPICTNCHD
jgi:hypothetical protein